MISFVFMALAAVVLAVWLLIYLLYHYKGLLKEKRRDVKKSKIFKLMEISLPSAIMLLGVQIILMVSLVAKLSMEGFNQ